MCAFLNRKKIFLIYLLQAGFVIKIRILVQCPVFLRGNFSFFSSAFGSWWSHGGIENDVCFRDDRFRLVMLTLFFFSVDPHVVIFLFVATFRFASKMSLWDHPGQNGNHLCVCKTMGTYALGCTYMQATHARRKSERPSVDWQLVNKTTDVYLRTQRTYTIRVSRTLIHINISLSELEREKDT